MAYLSSLIPQRFIQRTSLTRARSFVVYRLSAIASLTNLGSHVESWLLGRTFLTYICGIVDDRSRQSTRGADSPGSAPSG